MKRNSNWVNTTQFHQKTGVSKRSIATLIYTYKDRHFINPDAINLDYILRLNKFRVKLLTEAYELLELTSEHYPRDRLALLLAAKYGTSRNYFRHYLAQTIYLHKTNLTTIYLSDKLIKVVRSLRRMKTSLTVNPS